MSPMCASAYELITLLLLPPAGYYNNGTQYYCAKCPLGSTTPWMGATSVDDVSMHCKHQLHYIEQCAAADACFAANAYGLQQHDWQHACTRHAVVKMLGSGCSLAA
jgi:hypothetical protein